MSAAQLEVWTAERCARLLPKAKKTPTGWKACCPAHEDHNPSLFLADGADGLALVCYAGCDYNAIATALEQRGAQLKQTRDPSRIPSEHFQLGAYHAFWDYRDAAGRVLLRVCRWERPGGEKEIRPLFRSADGWKWAQHPAPRPLFQLDRLANEPYAPVLVVEGEKTAAAAQRLFSEHVVTTWPGGAKAMEQAEWSSLHGREITLIPDCDLPGRKAMAWVAMHLKTHAQSLRMLDPQRLLKEKLPEGWDLADALAEKRDVSEWLLKAEEPKSSNDERGSNGPARADGNREHEGTPRILRLRSAAEILANPVKAAWLIHRVLEQAVLAILFGDLGTLKSFLALDWALHLAAGKAWLGGSFKSRQCSVVYISAEGRGIDKRLRGWAAFHGVDVSGLPFYAVEHLLDLSTPEGIGSLVAAIEARGITPMLIVIDTLSRNCGPLDEDHSSDMAPFLNRLDELLRVRFGCSVLLVHHVGHGAKDRTRGSYALLANTDASYRVERPDPAEKIISITTGRLKDCESPEPIYAMGKVVDLGTLDAEGDPESTLVLVPTHSRPQPTAPRPSGKNQSALLAELERRAVAPDGIGIWSEGELREIGRGLGMGKQSARDAVLGLRGLGYFTETVGGCRLAHVPDSGQKRQKRQKPAESARGTGAEKAERPLGLCLSALPPSPAESESISARPSTGSASEPESKP